ncbi:bola-like protein [Xylariaceae sp. FL1019]|nr:bola-like protein [Xylariaceae sp. FL1019]
MLCLQCRRTLASAVRRSITQTTAQTTRATVSTTPALARGFLSPKAAHDIRPTYPVRSWTASYSTTNASSASSATPMPEKPDYLNDAESSIWEKLAAEFSPTELVVQDISGGCGSMYGIEIASEKFRGTNMLKQQRMVNAVLGEEMKDWHGVQLRTRVP